jgi:hypothetical protein
MKTPIGEIAINPSAVARVLGAVALVLVLASIGGQLSRFLLGHGSLKGLVRLFDVDKERNIPTFFSVLLMLFAALLLAVITALQRRNRAPHVQKWAMLFFGFLFTAFDEGFQVHENWNFSARALLRGGNFGLFYFTWVIFGVLLALVLALFFLRFLLQLPTATSRAFFAAATLYCTGALGFEMVGGHYVEEHGSENLAYNLIVTVEESFEMVGLIIFIRALLAYIAVSHGEVRFQFAGFRGKAGIDGP